MEQISVRAGGFYDYVCRAGNDIVEISVACGIVCDLQPVLRSNAVISEIAGKPGIVFGVGKAVVGFVVIFGNIQSRVILGGVAVFGVKNPYIVFFAVRNIFSVVGKLFRIAVSESQKVAFGNQIAAERGFMRIYVCVPCKAAVSGRNISVVHRDRQKFAVRHCVIDRVFEACADRWQRIGDAFLRAVALVTAETAVFKIDGRIGNIAGFRDAALSCGKNVYVRFAGQNLKICRQKHMLGIWYSRKVFNVPA